MVRKIFYGELSTEVTGFEDVSLNEKLALSLVVILILVLGIYPQAILNMTDSFSKDFIERINIIQFLPSKTGI